MRRIAPALLRSECYRLNPFASGTMLPAADDLRGSGMARRISMPTRTELVAAIKESYQRSSKTDRTSNRDEFVAVRGYHRKPAI